MGILTIDNFEQVSNSLLQFDRDGEFYMVLVLKRRKDTKGKMAEGVNEGNRLIKHFFVYDKEYFENKKDAIIALCEQNNARAYIIPQRRDCRLVLWCLHNTVSVILKEGSMNVHFDHLIRSCVAGMHETMEKWHKRWMIDIDEDDPTLKLWIEEGRRHLNDIGYENTFLYSVVKYAMYLRDLIGNALIPIDGCRSEEAEEFMPSLNHEYGVDDVQLLQTPHGWHLVTPPFNREQKAMDKYFRGFAPKSEWIKPDAMALLYAPATITTEGE